MFIDTEMNSPLALQRSAKFLWDELPDRLFRSPGARKGLWTLHSINITSLRDDAAG
ncbi:MAG TPA: hypothetical protein VIG25_09105 [Pyrinomonadaceae bacterium]